MKQYEDFKPIGNFYVMHQGYSGSESVYFYACNTCGQVYEQTHFFDPIDKSDKLEPPKKSAISEDYIEKLNSLSLTSITLPMGVKLGDDGSLEKIVQNLAVPVGGK
ncbi:MAG: hypothetical protein Q8O89_07300 [Nanoarchaeota archaeon]|nr:hypothetical protein [Nanoarchaeota archaeon]